MYRLRLKKSTIHTLFKWMTVFVVVNYSVGAILLSSFVIPQRIANAADIEPTLGLTYPRQVGTATKSTNGTYTMKIKFRTQWGGTIFDTKSVSGGVSKNPPTTMCYVNIHLKEGSNINNKSVESHELYPNLGGVNRNTYFCDRPFPFDRTYVEGDLIFTKLKVGTNNFMSSMKYGNNNTTKALGISSQIIQFTIIVNDKGAITGAAIESSGNSGQAGNGTSGGTPGDSANGAGGSDGPGGSVDKGEECPLITGGLLSWFKDNFLMKPICAATNLIASAATAIAAWTITTFFVPALGLT